MIVVSAAEMRRLDELTIAHGTPGYVLMERAGEGATAALLRAFPDLHGRRVIVVAGKGNNGGDGFVIARLLAGKGIHTEVLLLGSASDVRGDARRALHGLEGTAARLFEISLPEGLERLRASLAGASLLVDAIFGTGLSGQVHGAYADVVRCMNDSGIPIFAVDMPSGLDADRGHPVGVAVRASATATFGFAKIGQVIYPGLLHVGALTIVDIGIASEAVRAVQPSVELLEPEDVARHVPRRPPDAHKGTCGHLLIFAGSRGHTGAARMAAHAACRAGAGLTTVAGPASLNTVFALGIPEAMTASVADEAGMICFDPQAISELTGGKQAIVFGPGIGTHADAQRALRHILATAAVPIVIDADGLTCLAAELDLLQQTRCRVVLTPHPGEMARLLRTGVPQVQGDRVGVARSFAAQHRCVVILKGARSIIAAPDGRAWINPTGNPGMASGGMGDVLAGMLGGLLAQGIPPAAAACLAAYLHGAVADAVAAERGQIGLLASDVAEGIPRGLQRLAARGEVRAPVQDGSVGLSRLWPES